MMIYGPRLASSVVTEGSLPDLIEQAESESVRLMRSRHVASMAIKIALLALLAAACWRASALGAVALGVFAIFVLVAPSSYYWVMLVLVPLRPRVGVAAGVLALSAAMYGVELLTEDFAVRYTLFSAGLLALLAVWFVPDAVRTLKGGPASAE